MEVFYPPAWEEISMTTQSSMVKPRAAIKRETREALTAYCFIAPNFIGFCLFTLVPVVFSFVLAFMKWDGVHAMEFVALDNFSRMLGDKNFIKAFWNTILFVLGTAPLTVIFALLLAVLLNQKVAGRSIIRTISFFPYVASLVAVAAVWNLLFSPVMGPVNQLLSKIGVQNPPRWAAGKDTALITVILFSVWKNMGYYMVIYLAGLQGVNMELYEAASLDGASSWQKFCHVTLPQLSSTTFFVIVMVVIQSFKVFDQIFMITQGGPGTSTLVLVYEIFNEAFVGTPEYGYSSAISMVLFVLVLLVTIVQFKMQASPEAQKRSRRNQKGVQL